MGCRVTCVNAELGGEFCDGPCERDGSVSPGQVVDRQRAEAAAKWGGGEYDAARKTLTTAAEYVAGPRSADYGHPLDNHGRTAILWRAYLQAKFGVELELTEEDVCWLNSQQKLARDMNRPTFDGPVDVAGYAANVAEVRAERERRQA